MPFETYFNAKDPEKKLRIYKLMKAIISKGFLIPPPDIKYSSKHCLGHYLSYPSRIIQAKCRKKGKSESVAA